MNKKFFSPSDATVCIVTQIRKKYYSTFKQAKIITIMRNGKWSNYGTIRVVSDEQKQAGINGDYILTLSAPAWDSFNANQKKALVDHELAHMVKKETKKGIIYRCRHHDIEEFNAIVERYGEWRPNITSFRKSLAKGKS
ncbi:MAG: putative metallopeptidase [Janthinobacterium lividum]